MSIATDLVRLSTAKESLRLAINGKGRNIDSAALLDAYASEVTAIEAGGSGTVITPKSTIQARATGNIKAGDPVAITNSTIAFTPFTTVTPSSQPTGIQFSHSNKWAVASTYYSPYLCIYDTLTTPWTLLDTPLAVPGARTYGMCFSEDDTRFYVSTALSTAGLVCYDTTTNPWTKINLGSFTSATQDCCVCGDTLVTVHGNYGIKVYKLSGDTATLFKNDSQYAQSCFVSDDGRIFIHYRDYFWELNKETGSLITLKQVPSNIAADLNITCDPNSSKFIYYAASSLVTVDISVSPVTYKTLTISGSNYFAMTTDFTLLALHYSGKIYLYDLTTADYTLLTSISLSNVTGLDFSPTGNILVASTSTVMSILSVQMDYPNVTPTNGAISSQVGMYGYAITDILAGEVGNIAVLFS